MYFSHLSRGSTSSACANSVMLRVGVLYSIALWNALLTYISCSKSMRAKKWIRADNLSAGYTDVIFMCRVSLELEHGCSD